MKKKHYVYVKIIRILGFVIASKSAQFEQFCSRTALPQPPAKIRISLHMNMQQKGVGAKWLVQGGVMGLGLRLN